MSRRISGLHAEIVYWKSGVQSSSHSRNLLRSRRRQARWIRSRTAWSSAMLVSVTMGGLAADRPHPRGLGGRAAHTARPLRVVVAHADLVVDLVLLLATVQD